MLFVLSEAVVCILIIFFLVLDPPAKSWGGEAFYEVLCDTLERALSIYLFCYNFALNLRNWTRGYEPRDRQRLDWNKIAVQLWRSLGEICLITTDRLKTHKFPLRSICSTFTLIPNSQTNQPTQTHNSRTGPIYTVERKLLIFIRQLTYTMKSDSFNLKLSLHHCW